MITHIPNADITRIDASYSPVGGDTLSLSAKALPLQEGYRVQFSFKNTNPLVWDQIFGTGQRPRTGITIVTEHEPPTLHDLRWAYVAAKVRYEGAKALKKLEEALDDKR